MVKNRIRILVAEDEPKVASFIRSGLEENGYFPDVAYDGLVGEKMFENGHYDLVILDINLPYINGIQLCRNIRNKNQKIPILFLTALGTMEDKLQGFDSGADDYLVKPFEFRELLARIRSLLKRIFIFDLNENLLTFQDLVMNLASYEVMRNHKNIDLTPKEFALLKLLLQNKGRVITRLDIAEKVWDVTFDTGTNVIDVYINFLRKKIDKEFSPKLIHTVPGIGYVLKAGKE